MSQLSPGNTTFNSSSPFTVNGDESAETNLRPHGRSLSLTCGSATHIRSNTDVAKIVTWQPVSIMNLISISFTQPVRNHGATEPTAPTTMASPSSGWPCSTSCRGSRSILSSPRWSRGPPPPSLGYYRCTLVRYADTVSACTPTPECSNGSNAVISATEPSPTSRGTTRIECSNGSGSSNQIKSNQIKLYSATDIHVQSYIYTDYM